MMRLFAALHVPPEIGEGLARRQHGLEGARWRPLEALHVTLRFFGDVREDVATDLDIELAAIVGEPLELTLDNVGAFGEGRDIHAVWAGVQDNAALRQLASRCEAAARRAGLKGESRLYKPHVTLAYLSQANPVEVAEWIQANNLLRSPPFRVDSFGLYSSTLGPGGSAYRLEREYLL
jgi:2'-5' RNA ligase